MRLSLTIAAFAAAFAVPATAANIVTPPEYANTEGPSNAIIFNQSGIGHFQWQYSASLFGSTPMMIDGFSFRYDASVSAISMPTSTWNFSDVFRIDMGTAEHSIAGRVNNYDGNFGADRQTVLAGPVSINVAKLGHEGQMKGWGITFNFAESFRYDPTQGDLILDMTIPGIGQFGTIDYVRDDSRFGLVFGTQLVNSAPLTRFNTSAAVPEPATWAMMLIGFGAAGAAMRRRPSRSVRARA